MCTVSERKSPTKTLLSEYCRPKEKKFKKHAKLTDGIHVVYVGSIEFDPKSVELFTMTWFILSAQQVHLHIYPSHQHIVEEMQQNMKAFVTQEFIDSMFTYIAWYHLFELISGNIQVSIWINNINDPG